MTDDPRAEWTLRALYVAVGLVILVGGGLGRAGDVRAQGVPPAATRDFVQVELEAPMAILIDLLANDSSPQGEPLQVVIDQAPEVGELVPQWDGSLIYRLGPGVDLAGRTYVTASYWVEDSSGRASEVVDVCIGTCLAKAVADARADTSTVELGHTVPIPVLENDEGDGLGLVSCDATVATTGSVQVGQGDTCLYAAPQAASQAQPRRLRRSGNRLRSYAAVPVGSDSFEYTVADVYGNRDTATVAVTLVDSGGEVVGVVGRITGLTDASQTISFGTDFGVSFDNPVVIAQPITLNGGNDATLEITEVRSGSFRARIANTPPALPNHFVGEDASYLVVEGGSWEISPGVWLDAGVFETDVTYFGPNDYSSAGPRTVLLPETYPAGQVPLVLTQLQTNNAGSWSQPRLVDLTEERFTVALQRGEVDQQARVPHPAKERVGWLAITRGTGAWSGRTHAAGGLTCPGGAHPMFCILEFPVAFAEPPNLLAQIETLDDPEPAFLRYQNLSADQVTLVLRETYVGDDVDGVHGTEGFGYLVVEGDGALSAVPVNRPPSAGDQVLETAQDEPIEFGAQGTDLEGDQIRFATYELDGPGTVYPYLFGYLLTYEPPLGFSGTVTVRYTVQDDFGDYGLESHDVGVATIHVRPLVATIAPPVCADATCTFDAGPSSPEAVSFEWRIRNGVSGVTTVRTGKTVTHAFTSGGRHTASLTVTNAAGSQATDVVAVSTPPTAGFETDCTPDRVCSFTPSGTTADATSFAWSFGDGTSSSSMAPTHVYAAGGRYVVTLTVGNALGLEDSVASFVDLPPTAAFTVTCEGRSCTFTPTGTSTDAETFLWDLGDGTTSQSPTVSHTYAVGGRYQVRLTVGNAPGLFDSAVRAVDLPPTAVFTVSCDRGLCTFDATGSSGDATQFRWDFGDGATGVGASVTHQYGALEGTFVARLTVESSIGLTDSAEQTVEIELPLDLFLLLHVLD
ncbi:MAG: PKD domain-containing protein [Gemmatimonadota bacterium]|jgi:PKD repeat protein